jgi:hypothetical protein
MDKMNKSYTIKYEVHCKLQNFFNKEMIVNNCMSEMHAKAKLSDFCKKKYRIDYQYIIVISCKEKIDLGNIFGNGFPSNAFSDIFGGKK